MCPVKTETPKPLEPYWQTTDKETVRLYWGDVLKVLRGLPSRSIQCVVTSPPYWGLRDYGTSEWVGGDPKCLHIHKAGGTNLSTLGGKSGGHDMSASARTKSTERSYVQYSSVCCKCGAKRCTDEIGSEPTLQEYVSKMVSVFREIKRVLRVDGTVWLNLGDGYIDGVREGGIKSTDASWLAALIDGEGCIRVDCQERQGVSPNFWLEVIIVMKDKEMCSYAHSITKVGSFRQKNDGNWVWSVKGPQAGILLRTIYPWLLIKKRQAEIGVELCRVLEETKRGRGMTLSNETLEYRKKLKEACASCNQRKDNGIIVPPVKVIRTIDVNLTQGNLAGVPWRVAIALQEDNWILRQDIIWAKPNPMPESVENRCTKAHEYIFLLTLRGDYYYDKYSIMEDAVSEYKSSDFVARSSKDLADKTSKRTAATGASSNGRSDVVKKDKANKRSVWTVPSKGYPGAHFATFSPELIRPCIRAGTSEYGCCPECGKGWERVVLSSLLNTEGWGKATKDHHEGVANASAILRNGQGRAGDTQSTTLGWKPGCSCYGVELIVDPPERPNVRHDDLAECRDHSQRSNRNGVDSATLDPKKMVEVESRMSEKDRKKLEEWEAAMERWKAKYRKLWDEVYSELEVTPCVVLDPFMGSGTTAQVCIEEGRAVVGIELSKTYLDRNCIPRVEGVLLSRPGMVYLVPRKESKPLSGGRSMLAKKSEESP